VTENDNSTVITKSLQKLWYVMGRTPEEKSPEVFANFGSLIFEGIFWRGKKEIRGSCLR